MNPQNYTNMQTTTVFQSVIQWGECPCVHCPILSSIGMWPSTANVSQSVMYEDKEALLILPMLHIIMWRCLKHSVAAYRKPEQQSETSFRAENSYMIVRTTCSKGCETTRSLRRRLIHSSSRSSSSMIVRKLETAFVPNLSLFLSTFLPGFGSIHSCAEKAQIIFTFILSGGA